jgi:hypothetical protein
MGADSGIASDSDRSRTVAPIDCFNGSLGGVRVKLATLAGFSDGLRGVSPSSARRCAVCTRGSRMVSAMVDDFEQVAALLRGQRRQSPVVEDQKLDTGEALEEACIPYIAACQRKSIEQAWHPIVEHRSIVTACLVPERAGEPTFAGAGFAGDQEALSPPDPVAAANAKMSIKSMIMAASSCRQCRTGRMAS